MAGFSSEKPIGTRIRRGLQRAVCVAGAAASILSGCATQDLAVPVPLSGKREIPKVTFKNLTPPYLTYSYFQGGRERPFQPAARAFSLVNAWWLAEASTLAYAGEDFARSQFMRAGLPDVRFFSKLSTQCYVASNAEFAIVAFRGSEIWKKKDTFNLTEVLADFITDINIWPTGFEPGGKVHRGFKNALDEIWLELLPYLAELENRGCKIWITGHSLGGALATLCAYRYDGVRQAYTFGAPRVGNADFREHLMATIYRVVNDEDIVPRLPSLGIYVHVGELKVIDGRGVIRDAPFESPKPDRQGADALYGPGDGDPPAGAFNKGGIPQAVADHVPLLYAIHLWNNMIE